MYALHSLQKPFSTYLGWGWWGKPPLCEHRHHPPEDHLLPNQQRTLNKLPTELRRENFVTKCRLSKQIGTKMCKKVCATCTCSDRASFFACHRWWLGQKTTTYYTTSTKPSPFIAQTYQQQQQQFHSSSSFSFPIFYRWYKTKRMGQERERERERER